MSIIKSGVITPEDVSRVDIQEEHGKSFYIKANSPTPTKLAIYDERHGMGGYLRYEIDLDGQRASDLILTGDIRALTFLFDRKTKEDTSVEFTLSKFEPRNKEQC